MSRAPENEPRQARKSPSGPANTADDAQRNERDHPESNPIALPSHVAGSDTLDRLVDTARDYAKASTAENTNKAST